VKRRAPGSGNAEGKESSSEAHEIGVYGRHGPGQHVASEREKTLKVAWKCKRGERRDELESVLGVSREQRP
jgi:hypothetical protein